MLQKMVKDIGLQGLPEALRELREDTSLYVAG
jgi:hypothetical protein